MLTLAVPGLRRFLGLAALDGRAIAILTLAVIATWAAATLTNRIVQRPRGAARPRGALEPPAGALHAGAPR